ncbi:MAG TPA: PH domain-containing protein [Propionibacteriaceae bacterium]|nr:PH domain-containing protein [Propionibacteriaceae bacterium]
MSEVNAVVAWTFMSEIQIPQDVAGMMVQGEQPVAAFATFRDAAIFTTKRLIVRDAQGVTGRKVEVYSLPYTAIHMWSSENAGALDFNAEIELWTRAGKIKIKVGKQVDVRRLDGLIAHVVLNAGH